MVVFSLELNRCSEHSLAAAVYFCCPCVQKPATAVSVSDAMPAGGDNFLNVSGEVGDLAAKIRADIHRSRTHREAQMESIWRPTQCIFVLTPICATHIDRHHRQTGDTAKEDYVWPNSP